MSLESTPPATSFPPAPAAFYITGPTGVGKSEFAAQLAEQVSGEIVGADAFQIYAGLPILTAQPTNELRARVRHHLFAEIPLSESFDVAEYVRRAGDRIREVRARGKLPIVVGGTGLYIRSLVQGLAALPKADFALRAELEALPLAELNQRLQQLDPEGAAVIDRKNPRRMVRALEVCLLTGRPFSSFRKEWEAHHVGPAGVVLLRRKEELHRRIDARVRQMFSEGVVEEAAAAGELSETARQVLGFAEIQQMRQGSLPKEACIAAIQTRTRQYAKRQITWFAREAWMPTVELGAAPDPQVRNVVEAARRFAERS